jgi:hypothetical protein
MVSGATWLSGRVAESHVGAYDREASADIPGYTRPLNGSLGTDLEAEETVLIDAGELVGSNAPGSSSRVGESAATLHRSMLHVL